MSSRLIQTLIIKSQRFSMDCVKLIHQMFQTDSYRSNPQTVEILPVIKFVEPQNGQVFPAGLPRSSPNSSPAVDRILSSLSNSPVKMPWWLRLQDCWNQISFLLRVPRFMGNCVLSTNTLAPFDKWRLRRDCHAKQFEYCQSIQRNARGCRWILPDPR